MKHSMRLNAQPFDMIKQGIKTIELRLYDDKRKMIRVGDEIEFTNSTAPDLSLCCRVVALHKFSSFEELYGALPLLKCGYTDSDISTASPNDMDVYYPKEKQIEYGVIGIEIEVCR